MSVRSLPGQKNDISTMKESKACIKAHLNSLWSVWYGLFITTFQTYIAVQSAKRLLDYLDLPWGKDSPIELKASSCLIATAVIALPLFLATTIFKVGNLANDNYKLGQNLNTCSNGPSDGLGIAGTNGCRALWRHGGPTAPFLHILIAFCLLLPKLLMQGKLIKEGFLSTDNIWKTDIDFIVATYDRSMVLNFITSAPENITNTHTTTPYIIHSTATVPQSMLLKSGREIAINDEEMWGPVSIEFFNYALAHVIYSVRYPAVFWNTNKYWGFIFSFHLFINGIQNLLIYTGASILYKVHVVSPDEVLPTLPARYGKSFFLLNPYVTLALFIVTTALVISSSLVLYLYGFGRFRSFLNHEKACKIITVEGREWIYLTHCTALCLLLAILVVEGPMLVDLAVIYKSTINSSVLFSLIGAVLHLFIWVVVWLGLTLKQNWDFKLRVTVGKAEVRSARSIKLLTDVELVSSNMCESSAPLLVVASGRTYTVSDTSPKKTIIGAIHKAAMERKAKLQASSSHKNRSDDDDDQVYWLRPKPISPKQSPDSEASERISWYRKTGTKPKVTFDQTANKHSDENGVILDDDGDYARLREFPMISKSVIHAESNYLNDKLNTNERKTNLMPMPKNFNHEMSITPEPPELPPPPSVIEETSTPRCLRRADSGMPNDITPPRSDSEASASPPDHSETSSGVHSNSSRDSHHTNIITTSANVNEIDNKQLSWSSTLQNRLTESRDVIIRRRVEAEVIPIRSSPQDNFGRMTNMRMTSFTDSQSATLPHFPTQQLGMPHPHCSTMPLSPPMIPQTIIRANPIGNQPRHTTIPTHHNGIRLFSANNYMKKQIMQHRYPQHHSVPQLINPTYVTFKQNISNEISDGTNLTNGI